MPSSYESRQRVIDLKDVVIARFTQENWRELALLTGLNQQVSSHPRLLRSLSFGDDDYAGCALGMLLLMIDADERNLRTIEHYVGDKFDFGGISASSTPAKGKRIYFTPTAFEVPASDPDPNLIAVMMPFAGPQEPVYDAIAAVGASLSFTCNRADNIWEHSVIIQDIFTIIYRSFIVICDFSGRNPNVFYEAGVAHTLGKHVIPIAQTLDDIPFDLRHHRVIIYLNNDQGRRDLQDKLWSRVKTLAETRTP
jgi:hypothetical protein